MHIPLIIWKKSDKFELMEVLIHDIPEGTEVATWDTLPETSSLPLKTGRAPLGQWHSNHPFLGVSW